MIEYIAHSNLKHCAVSSWSGRSTEIYLESSKSTITDAFEKGFDKTANPPRSPVDDRCYAAQSGVPFANGAPNLAVDIPALTGLADDMNVPICGKDFKTGQTLMKTILAPGLKSRMIGLDGWYSTNILGNRDGEVLDDPENFKTKEESNLGPREYFPAEVTRTYKDFAHVVRINYYSPRGV